MTFATTREQFRTARENEILNRLGDRAVALRHHHQSGHITRREFTSEVEHMLNVSAFELALLDRGPTAVRSVKP